MDYIQATNLDPNNAYYAYCNRASIYEKKGDYDRAIRDYIKAISLDPNFLAYGFRGSIYFDKGDYDIAIADYEAGLRNKPGDAVLTVLLDKAKKARGW